MLQEPSPRAVPVENPELPNPRPPRDLEQAHQRDHIQRHQDIEGYRSRDRLCQQTSGRGCIHHQHDHCSRGSEASRRRAHAKPGEGKFEGRVEEVDAVSGVKLSFRSHCRTIFATEQWVVASSKMLPA
jgi:hypothetical protein